jgi:hypothetical protein
VLYSLEYAHMARYSLEYAIRSAAPPRHIRSVLSRAVAAVGQLQLR